MQSNTKYPWLDQKYVAEIEQRLQSVPEQYKATASQIMYSDYYQKQKREQDQLERENYKSQIMQKTVASKNGDERAVQGASLKLANVADMLRNKYNIDVDAADDQTLVNDVVDQLPQGNKMLLDYINGKNSNLLVKSWLVDNPTFTRLNALNEQSKVGTSSNVQNSATAAQKKVEATSLRSSSHFDDDNYASNYLAQLWEEWKPFVEWARNAWYIDWEIASVINAKQNYEKLVAEEKQRQQAYENRDLWEKWEELNVGIFQWFANFFANAYNNLFANNPSIWLTHWHNIDMEKFNFSDDLLGATNNYWDLRANSGWSKTGRVWGELIANIALMELMPSIWWEAWFWAESTLKSAAEQWWRWVAKEFAQRGMIWAAEWGEFWLLASMGQEDINWERVAENVAGGMAIWSLFWLWGEWISLWKAYNKGLSNVLKEAWKKDLLKSLQEAYNKSIKPTSRGVKSNTQLDKYNNDAMDSIELIVKNKNNLRFVDANGEEIVWELPRTVDEFSQAIKQTKQNLYDTYIQMAKQAGSDAWVDTSKVVNELRALLNDEERLVGQSEATKNEIIKWITDLEKLDNKMSMDWVLKKTQELNNELTAFFKSNNPNDVWPNSIKAVVNNWFKRAVDDTIENAWIDSIEYQNLKRAYGSLKNIESDVNHRAVVYGRQNPESLVDSLSNLSSIDAIAKFMKNPKEWTIKLIGSQLEKVSAKNRNNPNKLVKNLFSDAEKTINETSTLKTVAQQEAQAASDAAARQSIATRTAREQRMQERQRLRNRLEEIKAENEARYQEYQDYLRSRGVWQQALPENKGVNNYNTIIGSDQNPITVTPEGTSIRNGQIAEINKKSWNVKNQDYNYNNLDSNQLQNGWERINIGESWASWEWWELYWANWWGNQGVLQEPSMTDLWASQGWAWASQKPIAITDWEEMVNISKNLQSKQDRGLFMDVHTPEEYSSYQNFTNPNKTAAISVKPDHDIINFVSTEKWAWKDLMIQAIEAGGNKMDNYWIWLTNYYENFGFEPVARVKFNREYAPEWWNYARDWEPDIFVMKHNGDSAAQVRENYGKYKHKTAKELNDLPEYDYDAALEFRDSVMEIERNPDLTAAQKAERIKQKQILAKAKTDKDAIFQQYSDKFWSYVNPDEFRPYINNWGELEANLTHEWASWLADEYFNKLLKEAPKWSKWVVVAGWPWSWKWYSAKVLWIEPKDYKIFIDKTKGNKELMKMLDNWMDLDYYVVIPEADNIVDQITGRALSKGRTLPINSRGLPTHKEVVQVVEKVLDMQKNGANFRFHFVTNPWKWGVTRELTMEEWYKLFQEYASKLEWWTPDRVEQVVRKYKEQWLSESKIKELLASLWGLLAIWSLAWNWEQA